MSGLGWIDFPELDFDGFAGTEETFWVGHERMVRESGGWWVFPRTRKTPRKLRPKSLPSRGSRTPLRFESRRTRSEASPEVAFPLPRTQSLSAPGSFSTNPERPVSNTAPRFQETWSPPKEKPTHSGRTPDRPEGLPGRTTLTSCLSLSGATEVVVPSKAAQFPKRPLPGRCRLRVSSEPAGRNISATPTQRKAETNPDFATQTQKSRVASITQNAESPEKVPTEVVALSGFPIPGTPRPKARSSRRLPRPALPPVPVRRALSASPVRFAVSCDAVSKNVRSPKPLVKAQSPPFFATCS